MTGRPTPRDLGCTHPARQRVSLVDQVVTERCRLCDVVLVTDRRTGTTRVEVTGR